MWLHASFRLAGASFCTNTASLCPGVGIILARDGIPVLAVTRVIGAVWTDAFFCACKGVILLLASFCLCWYVVLCCTPGGRDTEPALTG